MHKCDELAILPNSYNSFLPNGTLNFTTFMWDFVEFSCRPILLLVVFNDTVLILYVYRGILFVESRELSSGNVSSRRQQQLNKCWIRVKCLTALQALSVIDKDEQLK